MDVIQAKSDIALKSSVEQLKGSVLRVIREIRAKLLHHIAYIETALDDRSILIWRGIQMN